jgi:outer membrane protein OmpA-like peptidoglycan-associated protein
LGAEIFGSTVGNAAFGTRTTPLALLFGGHFTAGPMLIGLGAGPGLSLAAGTPDFRALLSFDYIPFEDKTIIPEKDTDGDGVPDSEDACPDVPGVQTDDPKTNGCPADRDGDGIADSEDACPMVPGVKTNDPLTNGCPSDRDGDGIPDNVDACPDVAGIRTNNPKTNGCPSDRDGDGVFDFEDACPMVAGVRTKDPKTNGCPADRDGDGIVDIEDACPDLPGRRTSDPTTNGCPFVFIQGDELKITEQIQFATDGFSIVGSQHIIDEVAKILKEHPEIRHVRVQGHTDNIGTREYNKLLSSRRATAVLDALVKVGVAKERLSSQGYGKDNPEVTNGTGEGRTENRRVEFHIDNTAGH